MIGLQCGEKKVLASLSCAWDAFLALPDRHPSDGEEFTAALHQLQNLIAFRVARRIDPLWWSTAGVTEPKAEQER